VGSGVTAIAAGGNHSLFIKSDGSLWVMGWNSAVADHTADRPWIQIVRRSVCHSGRLQVSAMTHRLPSLLINRLWLPPAAIAVTPLATICSGAVSSIIVGTVTQLAIALPPMAHKLPFFLETDCDPILRQSL